MVRRNISKESQERWSDVDSVASFLVGQGTALCGVWISNIVEVGDVRYLDDSQNIGLPGNSGSHWSPGKNRRSSASPILKKKFSVASPSLLTHHLKLLLRRV